MNLLARAGLPVLWSSAAGPPTHAIATLRDEHRSLAAVLHAWLHALAAARGADAAADPVSMRSFVSYLQIFAEACITRRRRCTYSSVCANARAR